MVSIEAKPYVSRSTIHETRNCNLSSCCILRHANQSDHRSSGFEVLVWTVNTPATLRRVLKLNLRAVFTDYPGLMRASLTKLRTANPAGDETA